MARFFRNRFYLLAAVLGLTLASGVVLSQASPSVVPVNISPLSAAPTGLQTMATYQATGAGAANGYYSRPVLVSNNTLGGLANGMLRRAAPVAGMVAAVAAAGWVIDELTKQVMSGPPQQTHIPPGGHYWQDSVQGRIHATADDSAGYMASVYGKKVQTAIANCTPGSGSRIQSCQAILNNTAGTAPFAANHSQYVNGSTPRAITVPRPAPVAITNPQLGEVVKNNPHLWNEALRNADGSVNRNPEVMAEAEALRQSLLNPEAMPDPGAEWDTGNQGGEPQPGTSGQPFELPAFCSWASVVCSAIEWFQDDEDTGTDTPPDFIEPSLDVTWESGFGSGSCPAPVQFEVMGGEVVIPFDFLCDVAVYIRPVVLAAAALLALMIIGGYRRVS